MNPGLRQKAVTAVLGVVVLYALAVILWFTSQEAAWRKARKNYESAKAKVASERKMISQKRRWTEDYELEKKAMPLFSGDQATDTKWLSVVDELARTNHVWISQRENGKEIQAGDVYELEVVGRGWEGALESLVKFLHILENTDRGMFDVKTLNLKPNGAKKGYLKGSFSVSCAYMREE